MLIRLLIFSAFVLAVNLIAGIFAKELESDIEDWNKDDSSRMLHLISSQYLDSFGAGDISNSLKKPKINKRFAKEDGDREENTTEHRKVRKSISLRRRLQRNKSNEESLLAQESSHILGATAQPEITTSRSNNNTEEKSNEEKEAVSSLNETKATTESSESRTSSTAASASPAPRKRTRPPIVRTEAPSVPLAAAAAAALTMSESLYNHFRPLDKDVPEDHLLPFLDFGRKLIPSSKTSTSPLTRSSSSSSSTSSTNSIESATVAPSRSPSPHAATRYHISVQRKSNASVNSPSETTLDVRATTPREEEIHEDMDVSIVKPIVEKNKASRGRGGSAQFLRNLGGLYRKQDASSTTTIVVTPTESNVTESTTVASKEAVNRTNAAYSDSKEKILVEDQLARAQELPRYTVTTKRIYSAKLVSTESDMSASETATYRSVSNATASTSTSSQAPVPSKQWAASSSVIEATLPSPLLEKKRNATSFMLLNRRPPLRGISVNRHNQSRNSSDETKSDSGSSGTVNQTSVPSEEKLESLNISSRGKMSFELLPQNPNKDYQGKNVNATQIDLNLTKTTPSVAMNASDLTAPQSSTMETTLVTSSPPSPTTKILSTAVVTSVSVKGAWPSSVVTNVPLPEPTLAPPNSQQGVVTSEKPITLSSGKHIPQSANNSTIALSEETSARRTKNITLSETVSFKKPPATTFAPNSSTIPPEVTSLTNTSQQINATTSSISITSTTLKPRTTTLTGKLGSRRRIQPAVSSVAKHSSFPNNNNNETASTTQSSAVFTRSSKSPNHFRFPLFTTTRAPWRPSSTTTRTTSTSATTTTTATTTTAADLLPKVVFPTLGNQPSNTTLVSSVSTDLPSSTSFAGSIPSSAETSPVSVRTISDTSEFDLPLWRLYNASTVLFPSSSGTKPTITTVDSNQTPKEPGAMEEAVVRKEVRNDNVSEVQNKTLENVTEGVILDASEVRPSPGVGIVVYVTAALAIVPAIIIVALTTKYLLNRRKKLLDDSDAYSDISSRRDAVTTSCQQSESDLGSPITGTKLPRVPTHLTWDQEKPANPGNGVTSSNWEFPRSKLRLQTVLGQGNFGQVLKAEADDICGHQGMTRLVAVKTVKEGASAREKEDLLRELEIMQHLGSHTNVVTLLGCCTEKEPYLLIMEYVMYGKLLTFLRDHRTRQHYFNFSEDSDALTSRDLLVFAYCVARGMEYLTSKGIVHRDLAARNVLVDHNKMCKIADFGMSRNVREMGDIYEQRHSKGALPIRWMAPESLIYRIFTHKSDVWSFGILMWEIVTLGSTPYPQMGAREVMRRVCDGYRLERPNHCRMELFRIISWCWSADPNKRLDFSELKRELGVLLENSKNGTGYVDLESFEESKYNYSKTPVISHRHHHHHHHHHHQQQSSPSNHHSSPATATLRSIGDAEEIVVNM